MKIEALNSWVREMFSSFGSFFTLKLDGLTVMVCVFLYFVLPFDFATRRIRDQMDVGCGDLMGHKDFKDKKRT